MIIAGIDPGVSSTGYAVFDGEKLVSHGTIKVPTRKGCKTFSEKLTFIVESLPEYLRIADKVYVEQTFYKFKQTETSHHKFCGVIEITFGSDRTEYIAPTSVKKEVCGSGKTSKEEIQEFVTKEFNVEYESPDEADAIAIAYAGVLREKDNVQKIE